MTGETECPICFDEISNKCISSCNHVFCQDCILKVFISEHQNICPLCRHPLTLNDVKSLHVNKTLYSMCNFKILGAVYVQGSHTEYDLGLASYHFESETDCYISYASPHCMMWPSLDNGERPPVKKPFVNVTIDENGRTFRGDIVWHPTSWRHDKLWVYEMHFSEDYNSIESGTFVAYDAVENGSITRTQTFNTHLIYRRLYGNDVSHLLST